MQGQQLDFMVCSCIHLLRILVSTRDMLFVTHMSRVEAMNVLDAYGHQGVRNSDPFSHEPGTQVVHLRGYPNSAP